MTSVFFRSFNKGQQIVGYGECLSCGGTVKHRKGLEETKTCSPTCRSRYRRAKYPEKYQQWYKNYRLKQKENLNANIRPG